MMFCPKCGSLLTPKKEKNKVVMSCSCGYTNKKAEATTLKEEAVEQAKIEIIEDKPESLPLIDSDCPKCGHKKAYYWIVQTRASDEPETKFQKCEKCKHTWRDYS